MVNGKKVFEFEIEGDQLLPHPFLGQAEEKQLKMRPDAEIAEKHAYRNKDGELYIPNSWIRGSLINAFISRAGNKEKMATKMKVSPRITVSPMEILLGKRDYVIHKVSSSVGNPSRGGARDWVVRPLIENWCVKGSIITTLDIDLADMRSMLEVAGEDIGIGSNRPNGYGRFTVNSLKLVT